MSSSTSAPFMARAIPASAGWRARFWSESSTAMSAPQPRRRESHGNPARISGAAAGFVTMATLVAVLTALLMRLTPSWVASDGKPQPGYIFVNLGYSFLAAAAGGYVTALLALQIRFTMCWRSASLCCPRRLECNAIQGPATHLVPTHPRSVDANRCPGWWPRTTQSVGNSLGVLCRPTTEPPDTNLATDKRGTGRRPVLSPATPPVSPAD